MRWLRLLRARKEGERPPLDPADLELALQSPVTHTRALALVAQEPGSPLYLRAESVMARWAPRLWLELDGARLDAGQWYADAVDPLGGWSAAAGRSGVSELLLVLASTHRDGHLRERLARQLVRQSGRLASAALALRAVDHVSQVRKVAREALEQRRDSQNASVIMPILLAADERQTALGAADRYRDQLSDETRRTLVESPDRATRRNAIETAPLPSSRLVEVAASDPDLRCRLLAARRALALDGSTVAALLAAGPASVQALAVDVAPDELILPQITKLLLDRSPSLRLSARTRARKLGIDPASEYRTRLPMRTAVLGLGETGTAADVDTLLTLQGENFGMPTRRAAVHAFGWLAPTGVALARLPPLLDDEQPGVVREAARQLRRLRFTLTGEPLDRALRSPQDWTRQAALWLTPKRGWARFIATLTLYNDANDGLRETARSTLSAPIQGWPSNSQATRLQAALDAASLPAGLARTVRFHAGLPPDPP
jgi:hypothetical protein